MNRTEEGAIECSLQFVLQILPEQSLPGALLHFVRGTVREGDDDQARQNLHGARRTSDGQDPFGDRCGLSGTGRCDHGKIAVQLTDKTSACVFVAWFHHVSHSSFSTTSAGCVSAHLSSKISLSIGNVASG